MAPKYLCSDYFKAKVDTIWVLGPLGIYYISEFPKIRVPYIGVLIKDPTIWGTILGFRVEGLGPTPMGP